MKIANTILTLASVGLNGICRLIDKNMIHNPLTELQNLLIGIYFGFGCYAFVQGFGLNSELLFWIPFCGIFSKDFLKGLIFLFASFAAITFYSELKCTESVIHMYYSQRLGILTNFSGILTGGTIAIMAIIIPLGGSMLQQASESINDEKVLREFVHPIRNRLKNEVVVLAIGLCTSWLFPGHAVFQLYTCIVVFMRMLLLALEYFDYSANLENVVIENLKADLETKVRIYIHDKLKSTI